MCFVRACWVGFIVNDIAPWLSHQITIPFFSFMYLNSFMIFVIHMVSMVTCILAMYLASVVDKTIVGCCLLLQEMAPPLIMNTNPVVDLLSSRSLVESTSQYLTISWGGNPPNRNLNCKVPCKYRKMCLTIIHYSKLGLAMCLTHHPYWVCQIQPSTQDGIHQGSNYLLIKNLHHLNILVRILLQLCLGIKWYFNGFTIFHVKMLENLLKISNLVDVKKTCTILFHFHTKEKMQITKIFHFELSRKFFLHVQNLVLIIPHQDEIINIDNNENLDISHLCNIHVKIHITPHKLNVFQGNI